MSVLSCAHEALRAFQLSDTLLREPVPYGEGHINDTFLCTAAHDGSPREYVLQRIRKTIFKQPEQLMENAMNVTEYLRAQITARSGDPTRETLTFLRAEGGRPFAIDSEGEYWRVALLVPDTVTYQAPDSEAIFAESARAFGAFQLALSDYPAHTLHETIPHFHDTPARFAQLEEAIARDAAGRVAQCRAEIDFALGYREECGALTRLLAQGQLPLRVTHNDTKLNNVLIDTHTGKGLCVVDLDTVMPGLAAHDFGDAIRFGANTGAEGEQDLTRVSLSLPMYEAYARGYLEKAARSLTALDIDTLPLGVKLMTYECGIRFLADHLNGDTYFKTAYEGHNLVRARSQLALVRDIERKWAEITAITARLAEEARV